MDQEKLKELTMLALTAAFSAGKKILEIYQETISVDYKTDGSPLTKADNASHDIIVKTLQSSGLPVLSEEGKETPFEVRKKWNHYWLVDPLDGTKEFIKRNGEFTVNIALMENNHPVAGIVFQPLNKYAFAGIVGHGLYKFQADEVPAWNEKNKIELRERNNESVRVVASRTHNSSETTSFIDDLRSSEKKVELLNAGSALKFCLLVEGAADVYPRFAPTMEWDTAAGHALLKSVGKNIYLHPGGAEMTYNKQQLINEWFIAR